MASWRKLLLTTHYMALRLSILIAYAEANFPHTHEIQLRQLYVIDNIHINDCRGGKLIVVTDMEAC